jgi:hypothetical protein
VYYFKILPFIRNAIEKYPVLKILVISIQMVGAIVVALSDRGIGGYMLKNHESSICQLLLADKSVTDPGVFS